MRGVSPTKTGLPFILWLWT